MPLLPRRRRNKPTPTRQQTGTSYSAQGAAVKAPQEQEYGSQLVGKLVDRVPDVGTGYIASQTYKRMVRDDSSVRISLRAGKAPVLGAEFFIDPYDQTDLNLLIWEFVSFNLFNGMTLPWSVFLEQVLKMYESARANSVFELVWENREWAPKLTNSGANRKNYTMLRKLAYRPDQTITDITYDDNGGPVSVSQTAQNANNSSRTVDIPVEKLVVFVLNQDETGIEGMPMLRSAYKHWWYKDRFYNIDAIQKERHGIGVPDIEVQPGASPKDWQKAHELGRNLRVNEYAHIVRPPTIKVGFAEVHGNLVDALKSAEHHDTMIMKNIMVQFLNLGSSGGGGGARAAAATHMDMFMKAMRHVANSICDAINLYVIPQLVAYNFKTDSFPQIKVRNVGEVKDLQMWSAAMRNLITSGAISVDEQTEAWIRQQMDMPKLQTPWIPPAERPDDVRENINIKAQLADILNNGNGNGSQSTSKNGGAGNVGKSESSAAV